MFPLEPHIRALEAEAIGIIREAAAASARSVLLYSIGKDSSVLLHLAMKAFAPAPLPIPLLHVDTTYKFREMIDFRDATVARLGLKLLIETNHAALAEGINPFDHDASTYTAAMKTVPLRHALDRHGFDIAIGGARRDEERSRAKERVFSLREPGHVWNPRNQRPEFFGLYNTALAPGFGFRCFPLSNWTELDVWRYIAAEAIPVVPLYFAKPRPAVSRAGQWIMVDDARFRLLPGETIESRTIRFRTLGCYPLSAGLESQAGTVADIIEELGQARRSERVGRVIDHVGSTMEEKKREGYF
ncbi:sulfate adenylyltransferase subunit CysD [Phreatobacter aquaticus]|uniref:Sulfate adenylyltransferase subunit 2 n=1 Tax=Phreatobacter aquaticus TaxID=2570229 RepID=A0A4D7QRF5_9HYPH|nr:sulfate adenylyltransferase subunit CysD [Phreatobacter aquaticus]QCK88166.1 sulfate adenylyltransferase subunit CysD [Phreatobacter aquaticus]